MRDKVKPVIDRQAEKVGPEIVKEAAAEIAKLRKYGGANPPGAARA